MLLKNYVNDWMVQNVNAGESSSLVIDTQDYIFKLVLTRRAWKK